jgi:hypothetical protein
MWRNDQTKEVRQSTTEDIIRWINAKGYVYVKDGMHHSTVQVVFSDPPSIRAQRDGHWNDALLTLPKF